MSLIERAKAHMARQGRRQIEVPEWGEPDGKPLIIYVGALTVAEHKKLFPGGKQPDAALFVEALLLKAEDAAGKKLFSFDDRHMLMTEVDSSVVARVAGQILTTPSMDEAAKN